MRNLIILSIFIASQFLFSNQLFALDLDKEIQKQNQFAQKMAANLDISDRKMNGKKVRKTRRKKSSNSYGMKVTLIKVSKKKY